MSKLATIIAATCLLLTHPGSLLAHGNEDHKKPKGEKPGSQAAQQPWGKAGDPKKVDRQIEVRMSDAMRFSPESIQVKKGETIRFVVHNDGKLMHEFVIGTEDALDEHAAMMMKFPDMAHDESYMAHVAPGANEEIVWRFNRPGEFGFACLIAGHYQAGMKGGLKVEGTPEPMGAKSDMPHKGVGMKHSVQGRDMTEGVIRRIDRERGTLMIEHGEIPNLKMPPMAMMFHVDDPKKLEKLKPGDAILFKALHQDNKFMATEITNR